MVEKYQPFSFNIEVLRKNCGLDLDQAPGDSSTS
jgi:hypothetical protein